MSWFNNKNQYGAVSKILHGFMGLLILIMIPVGLFMDSIPDKSLKNCVYSLHKGCGLLLLFLIFIRILWKIINTQPQSLATQRWQQIIEHGVQHAFYTVLVIMPFSGWAMSTAANHPVKLFGQEWNMPFIPVDKKIAELAHATHEYIGYLLIALLILHISAALKHHFIDKDDILKRMS